MKPLEEELRIDVSSLSIPDAYDKEIFFSNFRGKVVVLSGGGRGAVSEAKKWDNALHKKAEERGDFIFFAIGFVGKLPPVVPKLLVKKEAQKTGYPTLLDWKGAAENILGLTDPNSAHIFIVDKEGCLRYKLVQNFSEGEVQKVLDKVEVYCNADPGKSDVS